jgi:hypothetical protein
MSATEPAGEKIARHLQDAVAQLHEDIARVELWAGALGCFARPVPDYDVMNSKYLLPAQTAGNARGKSPVTGARKTAQNDNGSGRKGGLA